MTAAQWSIRWRYPSRPRWRMYAWIAMIMSAGILCTGCTHLALQRRTINQGSTLNDLQYQQVLDNVAMFCCNKDALPWHLKLRGGLVQVTDQGQAILSGAAGGTGDLANSISPAANALRGVLGQWDLGPTVDPGDLELLRLVYRKAVYPNDPDLPKEILKQICDLCIRYDLLPQKKTIQKILLTVDEEGKQNGVEELGHIISFLNEEIKSICEEECYIQSMIESATGKCKKGDGCIEVLVAKAKQEEKLRQLKKDENFKREQISVFCGLVPIEPKPKAAEDTPTTRVALMRPPAKALLSPNSPNITLDDTSNTVLLILTAMHAACPAGYLPKTDLKWETGRNLGLVDQAEDQIKKLEDLLEKPEFNTPWFYCGNKKDVPKCACYVGHYCRCGRECYVWVIPEQMASLREFTLAVLTLAPTPSQDMFSLMQTGRGAAFSPSIGPSSMP